VPGADFVTLTETHADVATNTDRMRGTDRSRLGMNTMETERGSTAG
jgi:hypothetical protein